MNQEELARLLALPFEIDSVVSTFDKDNQRDTELIDEKPWDGNFFAIKELAKGGDVHAIDYLRRYREKLILYRLTGEL